MSSWLGDLIRLFFPAVCAGCGESLVTGEKVLCTRCLFLLPRSQYHLSTDNPVSRLFWGRVTIEQATALYVFEKGSIFQSLIHQLKYRGRKDIGLYLGRLLGTEIKDAPGFSHAEVIIPVPLHPSRKRERGYNQGEYIAKGMAEVMQAETEFGNLVRKRKTPTQTRRSRIERWENVRGMFAVKKPHRLENRHILLVDDVVTTGATLEACAEVLLGIPGVRVSIATLAVA
ncbi:MAG TPA: ComF family protein [Bacteroidetes bacterium]|nr:ComF family protein [Bacteroidota bacterium]